MPELPEVETLKLGLQKYIVGKKILSVLVKDRKVFSGDEKNAVGATIIAIRRFAKGIVIDLDNNYSFAIHIKLTGQLIFRDEKIKDLLVLRPSPQKVPNAFTRVTLVLSGKSFLYFNEVRGFAWMKLLKTKDVLMLPFFKSLGPEAIATSSSKQALTLPLFESIVHKSNVAIKPFLMDQAKIGGVGNIYANDACFAAKIDPRRKAKILSKAEIQTLFDSLLQVLKKALHYRGSSELNFVDVLGKLGEYQKHMLVYGRKGKPCMRDDGGVIEKIKLTGRGTYFCDKCQK